MGIKDCLATKWYAEVVINDTLQMVCRGFSRIPNHIGIPTILAPQHCLQVPETNDNHFSGLERLNQLFIVQDMFK